MLLHVLLSERYDDDPTITLMTVHNVAREEPWSGWYDDEVLSVNSSIYTCREESDNKHRSLKHYEDRHPYMRLNAFK